MKEVITILFAIMMVIGIGIILATFCAGISAGNVALDRLAAFLLAGICTAGFGYVGLLWLKGNKHKTQR